MALTKLELKLIEMALPSGIIDRRYLFGANELETRKVRAVFTNLVKLNVFKRIAVATRSDSGSDIHRFYLTEAGFREYINSLFPSHLLYGYNGSHTIRTGLNAEGTTRLVRLSDARTILASFGVRDVFATTITSAAPFENKTILFKAMNKIASSNNYNDAFLWAVLDRADRRMLYGDLSTLEHPVFFDKRFAFLHFNKKGIFSSGLVANFQTGESYSVYKYLEFPCNSYWKSEQHYEILNYPLVDAGIKTDDYKQSLNALLLLDTYDQLLKFIALMSEEFPMPYKRFVPIIVNANRPKELHVLRTLLYSTYVDALNATQHQILAKYPHLRHRHRDDNTLMYVDGGTCFTVGTIINLYLIRQRIPPNWIVFDDQYDLYRKLFPSSIILTIPRP